METRAVKILFLDAPPQLPVVEARLAEAGLEIVAVPHGTLSFDEAYGNFYGLGDKIKILCGNPEIEIVILGNNRGAGFVKAKSIPQRLKDRTIVLWNNRRAADEQPYAQLGFKHFGNRCDIVNLVKQILEDAHPSHNIV
jgi:hypothetical protein